MRTLFTVVLILIHIQILPQNQYQKIDKLMSDAFELDLFSGVVLIAEGNDIKFLKAYGYSDAGKTVPNNTDTKFNIGSIGKLFTQVIIVQLVQERKLELTDNLKKVYPLFKNDYDEKITIKHLLTFTSGLDDYFRIDEFRRNPYKYKSATALAELISKQPLLFEPGEKWEYSNSGYAVLGAIIEKITGKTYEENLNERILSKLGMSNSGFIYKDTKTENKASGLLVLPSGTIQSTDERVPTIPTAAGGMFSTVKDLFKFDRSLMTDNILLKDEYKVLLFSRYNPEEKRTWKELYADKKFGVGYAGGSPGWNSVYDIKAAGKYTVLIFSNYDGGAEEMIERVNTILEGNEIAPLRPALGKYLFTTIKEKGSEDFLKNYGEYIEPYGLRDDIMLNNLGYQFLNAGLIDEAVAVFIVNTRYFPEVANTYDSLGEAYMKRGDKELAITNYKKSLELDPGNKNAEEMLKILKQ